MLVFDSLVLSDVDLEDTIDIVYGNEVKRKAAVRIKGHDVNKISVRMLRKVCSYLKVSGHKNKSKAETLVLIG